MSTWFRDHKISLWRVAQPLKLPTSPLNWVPRSSRPLRRAGTMLLEAREWLQFDPRPSFISYANGVCWLQSSIQQF
jgi:hypothetical protein